MLRMTSFLCNASNDKLPVMLLMTPVLCDAINDRLVMFAASSESINRKRLHGITAKNEKFHT